MPSSRCPRERAISAAIRLGTRGSKLALAQATAVQAKLEPLVGPVEIEVIRTSGDRGDRDRLGAFVKEIQEALLDGRVDIGLHCLKDLPTSPVTGLHLAAYLEREDPSDAILSTASWQELPTGSLVGTGSARRSAQLAAIRPDLHFKPLVGNVDTRLRKLMTGEYDAIVLAIAGLRRLGILDSWQDSEFASIKIQKLESSQMLPAPGQAVLVLETRTVDAPEGLNALDHLETRTSAIAERSFLSAFGGGCSVPVAALCEPSAGSLQLQGLVSRPDGSKVLRGKATGQQPEELGQELASRLIQEGAMDLFASAVGRAET